MKIKTEYKKITLEPQTMDATFTVLFNVEKKDVGKFKDELSDWLLDIEGQQKLTDGPLKKEKKK